MLAPASHHLWYGQSKAAGGAAFTPSGGVRSTIPLAGAVMFNQGIRSWQEWQGADARAANITAAKKRSGFVPLAEEKAGSQEGEVGAYGFAEAFWYMLNRSGVATTNDLKLILSSAAEGSRSLALLSKGSEYFQRIVDDIAYGRQAAWNGKFPDHVPRRYAVESVTYDGSEDDAAGFTPPDVWKFGMGLLKTDVEAEAGRPVPFFVPQLASHQKTPNNGTGNCAIALAQLELGLEPGNGFYCPGPMYPFVYQPEPSVHFTAQGAYERGLYCGLAAWKVIVNGETDFEPLHPIRDERDGLFLRLQFGGVVGNLAISNPSYCPTIGRSGFVLRDPDGTLNETIRVAPFGDTVEFTFARTIVPGSTLRGGLDGSGVGSTGPRTNLRDSQGDQIVIGGRPMHNWCVMFERLIA